jgi:hypothetical protein
MVSGTRNALAPCQPAPSSTMTAWVSAGTVAAKSARKRVMAAVETRGSTRQNSSPVAGRTAAKM